MVWEVLESTVAFVEIELSWKVSASVMRTVVWEILGFGAEWVVRTIF